ncbi:MAG: MFS transporter, partial [Gammaproteobacteria bacterium]
IILVAFAVKEGPLSDRAKRPKQSVRESFGGLSTILRTPSYIWLALFSLTALGPAFSVIGLLSGVYLRERFALDPVALGNAVLVLLVALNLGGVVYGPLDRWATHRKRVIAGGIVVQVTALSLLAALDGLSLWSTLGFLIVFAGASQLHALVVAHAQSLFPRDFAGRVITTTNLFMIGGIFLFQFLSGYAHEFFVNGWGLSAIDSYRLTFAVLAVAQCVGILLYAKAPVPETT